MTISQLIKLGKYDWVNEDITAENFPNEPKPEQGVQIIDLKTLGITSEQAIKKLKSMGMRPATLTELLVYGKEHPKEPVKNWNCIVALGSVWQDRDGSRRVPYLYRYGSERELNLSWFDDGWDAHCRFAAVPQVSPVPSKPLEQALESFDPKTLEKEYVRGFNDAIKMVQEALPTKLKV